jgi:hypothetical protein
LVYERESVHPGFKIIPNYEINLNNQIISA